MGIEIERKFLLANDSWRPASSGTIYRQGYLSDNNLTTVRVRIQGNKGVLTIKGPSHDGARAEYEYGIPLEEASEMLNNLCVSSVVEKTRYLVVYEGFSWEIDEFSGENNGLIVAEIELESITQPFAMPPWLGKEVTDDPRYYNAMLAKTPYAKWKKSD